MINAKTGEYTSRVELGTPLQKIMLLLVTLSLLTTVTWHFITAPKTATVDAKHWECGATEPVGIEARCTLYRMKSYSLRTE